MKLDISRGRRGVTAMAAVLLSVSLAACSNGSGSTASEDTSTPATPAAPSTSMGGDTGGSDVSAQTFGPGCSAIPTSGAGSFNGMVQDPVATAASNNPLLSTLVTAVTKAGLVDTLNGAEGLTVFAPTNDAFAAIPKDQLNAVLANKALLTKILTQHVVAGQLDPTQIVGKQSTLAKGTVTVKGDTSGMTVDNANVVCGNIPTANATVYVIDQVLMP